MISSLSPKSRIKQRSEKRGGNYPQRRIKTISSATPMSWTLNLKEVRQQPFCAADLERIFRVSSPAPWSKLFSASFVRQHQLQFQNTPRNNDMYFTYCAMALAEKIVYVDEIFVHYRIGQNTNLQSGLSKTPTVCCEVLQAIKNRLEGDACWETVKDAFLNAAAENLEFNVRQLNDHPEAKRELLEAIDGKYFQEFGLRDYPIEKINERERYNHLCLELLCLSCENPQRNMWHSASRVCSNRH